MGTDAALRDATLLAEEVRSGRLQAADVVEDCLRRIERCQAPSNTVEQVAADPLRIVLVPELR